MAITGVNSCNNVYEATYASQKTKYAEISEQKKVKEAEEVKGKGEAVRKSSNEEYLKSIQKQVSSVNLETGIGLSMRRDNKIGTITIHPALLEKMQNDPEAAEKYTQTIKDIERAEKMVMAYYNALGGVVERTSHCYVDENGKYYHFGYTRRDDKLNKKLREEARKNAENLTERIREKTAKKKKELKISIEKAADENKEKEKMAERDKNTDKVNMGKAEQFLAGKTRQTKNGEVYLDTGDMQIIMEAVKEEWVKDEKTADETGANLDMKI